MVRLYDHSQIRHASLVNTGYRVHFDRFEIIMQVPLSLCDISFLLPLRTIQPAEGDETVGHHDWKVRSLH